MTDKPVKIQFANKPNVQMYKTTNIEYPQASVESSPDDPGPDLGDVTFTAHYERPWFTRRAIAFWQWITGAWRNN